MLELPITLRVPTPDEVPDRPDMYELLEKRKEANIRPGYTLKPNHTHQLPFKFYAEINVNNSQLWDLFLALAAMFPENTSAVYNEHDQDTLTTNIFPTATVLKHFSLYKKELSLDCNLEFGLLSHTRDKLTELSVSECKYLKFWGSDQDAFVACMAKFKLPHIQRLEFADEYPKIVVPLRTVMPGAAPTSDVVAHFDRAFNVNRENFY